MLHRPNTGNKGGGYAPFPLPPGNGNGAYLVTDWKTK